MSEVYKTRNCQSDLNLLLRMHDYVITMIQAEISIYPIATRTTSTSFYIAKAIDSIKNVSNLRYEINPMGTILESDDVGIIYDASKKMTEAVHNLGIDRVEVIIKIDSRRDKHVKMEEKLNSIKKFMESKQYNQSESNIE